MKKIAMIGMVLVAMAAGCNTDEDDYVIGSSSSETSEESKKSGSEANESLLNRDTTETSASIAIAKTLTITWESGVATVDSVAEGVEIDISGGDVTLRSTAEDMEYVLKGASEDGSLKVYSEKKYKLTLGGVSLRSSKTAAINNQGKKTLYLYAAEGTENTLEDAGTAYTDAEGTEDVKGCVFSEDQIVMCGHGTINVVGNSKHAIATDDYLEMKESVSVNIKGAVKDGIHANDYIAIEGGQLTIRGCGADGVESDEGAIEISGGVVDVETTGTANKNVKAYGDLIIRGGELTLTNSGNGEWDTSEADYSNAVCLKTNGNMTIEGGTIVASASGKAGRCIKANGDLVIAGGSMTLTASGDYQQQSGQDYNAAAAIKVGGNMTVSGGETAATVSGNGAKAIKVGGNYEQTEGTVAASASGTSVGGSSGGMMPWGAGSQSSSNTSRAKGIKVTGSISIKGGVLTGYSKTHEAIESKSTMTVTGGEMYGRSDADDAINSAGNMTIDGGYVCAYGTSNDGLDANGNLYIKGGVVFAVGSSTPEMAIDANTEGGYKLYITGGTVMTVGPLESGAQLSQSCYTASSWSKGTWYVMTVGGKKYAFKTPTGNAGSGIVVSGAETPTLQTVTGVEGGTTHFSGVGQVIEDGEVTGGKTVVLTAYTGGGSMGGGGRRW